MIKEELSSVWQVAVQTELELCGLELLLSWRVCATKFAKAEASRECSGFLIWGEEFCRSFRVRKGQGTLEAVLSWRKRRPGSKLRACSALGFYSSALWICKGKGTSVPLEAKQKSITIWKQQLSMMQGLLTHCWNEGRKILLRIFKLETLPLLLKLYLKRIFKGI